MEIFLAIVVAISVIFFGALISMGNERQRRAINQLREQITLWAIKDVEIKQSRLTNTVRIDDPIEWLQGITAKTTNSYLKLQVANVFDKPQGLVCTYNNGLSVVVYSPVSPNDVRKLKRKEMKGMKRLDYPSFISFLSRNPKHYESSILNNGPLFNLELQEAWKKITNQEITSHHQLWIYFP